MEEAARAATTAACSRSRPTAAAPGPSCPTAQLLTDPYDGPINASFSNPLAGLDAWCGDPQAWLNSIVVDLDAYAGQTVQFRFRLGTDSSVSHPGWDIDDIWVQSCVPEASGGIFADGFESGDTSAWSNTSHSRPFETNNTAPHEGRRLLQGGFGSRGDGKGARWWIQSCRRVVR